MTEVNGGWIEMNSKGHWENQFPCTYTSDLTNSTVLWPPLPARSSSLCPPWNLHLIELTWESHLKGVPLPLVAESAYTLSSLFSSATFLLPSTPGVLNLSQTEGQIHTCLSTRGPQGYEDNLLKLHGNLLTMLLTYYYKQVHVPISQQLSFTKSVIGETCDAAFASAIFQ
jgi:hypothetical protein